MLDWKVEFEPEHFDDSGIDDPYCLFTLQMVWATTNKVGCAVHTCQNMNIWGNVWKQATFLVCNYSSK